MTTVVMAEQKAKKAVRRADGAAEVKASAPGSTVAVSLSALREQAGLLRRAQELARLAHVITAPDGSFETWSETLPVLIGIPAGRIARSTRRWLELIHPADRDRFRRAAIDAMKSGERTSVEYRLWREGGGWIHVRQVMELIPGQAATEGRRRWFNTLQDITVERRNAERLARLNRIYSMQSALSALVVRVRSREQLFADACGVAVRQGAFRAAWIGVRDADGVLQPAAWAGELGAILASPPTSIVQGDPAYALAVQALERDHPAVVQDLAEFTAGSGDMLKVLGVGGVAALPLVVDGRKSGVVVLHAPYAAFFDEADVRLLQELAGELAFAIKYLDQSARAEYLAYFDPVTDLANRALFRDRLQEQLASAQRAGTRLALLIFDIEHFKSINDTYGRAAADEVLKKVAERLASATPGRNVARVGADVFAVVVPDVDSAEALMRGVQTGTRDIFSRPYALGDSEMRLSARLGIAIYPEDATDGEVLFRNAEAALKRAKEGNEQYLFYESGMSERVAERLALEHKLHRALEAAQFAMHYQPKVSVGTRQIVGVEALIRWNDPASGLVSPARFVPLLEATGLIIPVGAWVLGQAGADYKRVAGAGLAAPRVAVNISAVQLRHKSFIPSLEETVRAGVTPEAIELEITESVLMEDIDASISTLKKVRDLGFELAMDDFGTGYSSLAYLAKLPIQTLKIDRSFVSQMQDHPDAMTLVSTMVSLAHALKLKVVAEGVETEEQARILGLLRCDEMQGYLLSKPIPLQDLILLLRSPASA